MSSSPDKVSVPVSRNGWSATISGARAAGSRTHQHRITIVPRLTSHTHLRDEPLETTTRDGEMDVRCSARCLHPATSSPVLQPILEVGVTRCSGPRDECRRSGPTDGRCYAVRYPCGKTGRHGILRRIIPGLPCGSGRLIAHPCLELVHAASV
jgi:hypothetical protein